MKTPVPLFFAATVFLSGCATINLSSKKEDDYSRQIQSVYIQANPASKYDEDLYVVVVIGLKKELVARGIRVKEDFTDQPDSSGNAAFQADATLILEKNAEDKYNVRSPAFSVYGGGVGLNLASPTYDRFMIRLKDVATSRDIWVGMASVRYGERRQVAKTVAKQFEKDGLVPRIKK